MRKELLWAAVIGILFGLIIGFGVWRVRSTVTPKGKPAPSATPQTGVGQFKITIDKPENYGVVTESTIPVSGLTKALTWVVISTEKEDFITQSLENGTFSADIDLEAGVNHIKVTAVNPQGNTSSQTVLAVYSSSFQLSSPSPTTASSEADLNKAVALKIARAEKPPKSYIGTVTDIADSTIQIKTTDSQIQQIATDKLDVSVVNAKGTSSKAIKLTDIAIGDFIVAMGYVDGNEVLDAQRILVTDALTDSQITVSLGKVASVSKKSFNLAPIAGGQASAVTPDKNTDLMSFVNSKTKAILLSVIKESDRIILVTDTTGTPVITRSVIDLGSE